MKYVSRGAKQALILTLLVVLFVMSADYAMPARAQQITMPSNLDVERKHFYDSLTTFFKEYEKETLPGALTAGECLMIAEQNSIGLSIAQSKTRGSADKIDEVKSQQNPKLGLSGSYWHMGPIPQFSIPGFGSMKLMNEANFDLKLTGSYLISNFGTIAHAKKAAYLAYLTAKVNEERVEADLDLEVISSFFTIVETKGFMAVARQAISAKQLQYNIARANYDVGIFPKFEVIQADVGLKEAELEVIRAAKGLELVKAKMRNTMGLQQTVDLDVVRPRFVVYPFPELERAIEIAYENRPELIQMDLAVDIASTNIDLAYDGKNPALLLVSSYDYQTETFASLPTAWNVALSFEVPIFDGGETWSKVKQAREILEQTKLGRDQLKRDLALNVKSSHLSLMESLKKLETAEANIDRSKEAYDIALLRYQEGFSTNVELDNALLGYLTAHASFISAYCEYGRSFASLVHAMGLSVKGVYYDQGNLPQIEKN